MSCPLPIHRDLRRVLPPGSSVLLALSGGVDSAVSLAVLRALECEVLTVTFKNFCYSDDQDPGDKACCSLDAIDAARALAHAHGARHWVHDVSAPFATQVIEPFVAEYRAARTPNPCLACNSTVRFPELVRLADQQGCRLVATGHYARTRPDGNGGAELWRGVDPEKDQSYFLSQVPRDLWSRTVFPLGWSTKTEVRAAARALGLPVADKPESQEICFVPDGDRSFLFADDEAPRPGSILDTAGRVLGEHRGLVHYTVGQRRGVGIAGGDPLYVVALDAEQNRLVVGTREQLAVTRLVADGFAPAVVDFPDEGPPPEGGPWLVRVRHRHRGVGVARWRRDGDTLMVDLAEPLHGAAPGQGLTLDDGERVLGAGRLLATEPVTTERGPAATGP
jgi:tRNA-specific 2-thiouridylase